VVLLGEAVKIIESVADQLDRGLLDLGVGDLLLADKNGL